MVLFVRFFFIRFFFIRFFFAPAMRVRRSRRLTCVVHTAVTYSLGEQHPITPNLGRARTRVSCTASKMPDDAVERIRFPSLRGCVRKISPN